MAKDALREVNAHNVDAINKVAFMPKEEPKEETFFANGGHVEKKKDSDKLEIANKYNLKKFNRKENLFAFAGSMNSRSDYSNDLLFGTSPQAGNASNFGRQLPSVGNGLNLNTLAAADKKANPWNYVDDIDTTFQYMKGANAGQFKIPEQKAPQKTTMSPSIGAALGGAAGIVQNIGKSEENPNGLFDVMDPVHALAGGRQSGAGNAMGSMGVEVFKAGAMSGNPYIMAAGAGLKILGGLTNAAFGIKEDKGMKQAADASINANRNFMSNASSFDDIKGPASMTNTNVYEDGWFTNRGADKNAKLAQDMTEAYSWADRSVQNNISNISSDQVEDFLRNYSAFGGYLTRPKRRRRIKR